MRKEFRFRFINEHHQLIQFLQFGIASGVLLRK